MKLGMWLISIDPKDVGRDYEAIIRVNSQSGKAGSSFVLAQEYGLNLPKWVQLDFAPVAQKLAESHGGVLSHKALYNAFIEHYNCDQNAFELNHYQLDKQGGEEILSLEINGEKWQGKGNGTLSALCDAWQIKTGQIIDVIDYSEHAVHGEIMTIEGKNAQAIAYVYVQQNDKRSVGVALAEDSVSAMLLAVLNALN